VREIIVQAVEAAAAAVPDSVALVAVDIAHRHRLMQGQVFQSILEILRSFDLGDSALSESQLVASSLLMQTVAACSSFDDLPCSIVEHLLSISVKLPSITSSVQIVGDGIAVETSDDVICQWFGLMFKDNIAAPAFDWIVRWCNRAALQPQWLLPCRVQALLENAGSSKIAVNIETKLFVCLAVSQGWLCDLHASPSPVSASSRWWSKLSWV